VGTLPGQLEAFLVMALAGVAIAFTFDLYRALRSLARPRGLWSDLGDLLFCSCGAVLAAAAWLGANWGELRSFVPLGLVGGGALYFGLASPTVLPVAQRGARAGAHLVTAAVRVVLRPVLWPLRLLRRGLRRCRTLFRRHVAAAGQSLAAGRRRAGRGAAKARSRLGGWGRRMADRLRGGRRRGRPR
jgi:spore cortex biosynthesis protein YabQ